MFSCILRSMPLFPSLKNNVPSGITLLNKTVKVTFSQSLPQTPPPSPQPGKRVFKFPSQEIITDPIKKEKKIRRCVDTLLKNQHYFCASREALEMEDKNKKDRLLFLIAQHMCFPEVTKYITLPRYPVILMEKGPLQQEAFRMCFQKHISLARLKDSSDRYLGPLEHLGIARSYLSDLEEGNHKKELREQFMKAARDRREEIREIGGQK